MSFFENKKMKRNELMVTDEKKLESIIVQCKICTLAMCLGDRPYIIPLNFGYKAKTLYFHCASEGLKLDILKKNNNVSFQMHINEKLITENKPCYWSQQYQSVVGFGKIHVLQKKNEKNPRA